MIRVGRVGEKSAVYIGRPSELGNPFVIGVHGTRDEVCDAYAQWFHERVRTRDPLLIGTLRRLRERVDQGDLVLACYCAPRRCHGDVIKAFLEDETACNEYLGGRSAADDTG